MNGRTSVTSRQRFFLGLLVFALLAWIIGKGAAALAQEERQTTEGTQSQAAGLEPPIPELEPSAPEGPPVPGGAPAEPPLPTGEEMEDAAGPPVPEAPQPTPPAEEPEAQKPEKPEAKPKKKEAEKKKAEEPQPTEKGEEPIGWFSKLIWWLGKFHPAAISFPVGVFLAGAVAELLWMITGRSPFDAGSRFCAGFAGVTTPLVAMLGWFLAEFHPTGPQWVLTTHRWLGTSTAVVALAVLALSEMSHRRASRSLRTAYRVGLFGAAGLVLATGFFGGAMIYGVDHYRWPSPAPAAEEPTAEQPQGEAEPAAIVKMTNDMTFEPRKVTIQAGETVKWTNPSRVYHTVTADPQLADDPDHVKLPEGAETFNSGRVESGETYSYTFEVPGLYRYFCIPHEAAGMIGEVEVKPKDGSSS